MATSTFLPRYDRRQSYEWNYDRAPDPAQIPCSADEVLPMRPRAEDLRRMDDGGSWRFCGLPVGSCLGVPAGPLLNGRWCLYYARLGFDVVTYKTVRSSSRACYPLPNLQPIECDQLAGDERDLPANDRMDGSWAVSFGMPSKAPQQWTADVRWTRAQLAAEQLLSVSVVGTVQSGWGVRELAADYAACARLAVESGADCIETNFSCPNVATCDGQLYQHPEDSREVARQVREAIGPSIPYILKIGHLPDPEAAERLIDAVGEYGSALASTNSIATTVVAADGQRLFEGERRGICGTATREASIRQVAMLRDRISRRGGTLGLIGVGGVETAKDVRRYLDAGAHAVHIATAAMTEPDIALRIRREWNELCHSDV